MKAPRTPTAKGFDFFVDLLIPVCLIGLLGSLLYFLLDVRRVLVAGGFQSLQFASFAFLFAVVFTERIRVRAGRGWAIFLSVLVAGSILFYMTSLTLYAGGLVGGRSLALALVANYALVAFVWWAARRLTRECTIDPDVDEARGEGLLGTLFRPRTLAPPTDPALRQLQQRHHPGVSVITFSLLALLLFGLGQRILVGGSPETLRNAFWCMVAYLFFALALLALTSLSGLRLYLRKRQVTLPRALPSLWLGLSFLAVATILFLAWLPPKPSAQATGRIEQRMAQGFRDTVSHLPPRWLEGFRPTDQPSPRTGEGGRERTEGGPPQAGDRGTEGQRRGRAGQGQEGTKGNRSGQSQETGQESPGGEGRTGQEGGGAGGRGGREGGSSSKEQSAAAAGGGQPSPDQQASRGASEARQKSETAAATRRDESEKKSKKGATWWWWLLLLLLLLLLLYLLWRKRKQIARKLREWWQARPRLRVPAFLVAWYERVARFLRRVLEVLGLWWVGRKLAQLARKVLGEEMDPFENPFGRGWSPREIVRHAYHALLAYADLLGCSRQPPQTPYEYLRHLPEPLAPLREDATQLTHLYVQASYAPDAVPNECVPAVEDIWNRLLPRVREAQAAPR